MKSRLFLLPLFFVVFTWMLTLSSWGPATPAWAQQLNAPPGFTLLSSRVSVELYTDDSTGTQFVQIVNLAKGATVSLLRGELAPQVEPGGWGGPNPEVYRQPLQEVWDEFSASDENAFCVTNGQFFSTNEYPTTPLAFSLKQNGVVVSEGYASGPYVGKQEFPKPNDPDQTNRKLMLEIWEDRVDIIELTEDNFYNSSAPNIIAGLTEDADKGIDNPTGRTFVGIVDTDNNTIYETVLIFNSPLATQPVAAEVIRSFYPDIEDDDIEVMMLDGGGSTQLMCNGQLYVPSSDNRTIPQTLAVSATRNANGSAQAGMTWLENAAVDWQNSNNCIGCHVQPKAIQAAAIAIDNGFTVDSDALTTLMNFMKSQQGGGGDFGGWPIGEEHHAAPGYAAYDRTVSNDSQANMISLANWFLSQQQLDGRWAIDRYEPPVDQGDILTTANAITVLAQAYTRTNDPQFSTAMQLGAQWLASQTGNVVTTQDKTHIIIGLIASGRPVDDPAVQAMVNLLISEQQPDHGWIDTAGGTSTAFGTGQVLYALRLAGVRLDDPVVYSGVNWLIANQEDEGSWPLTDNSDPWRRSKYSPTMWGVLGLVQSVDLAPPSIIPPILPVYVPKWISPVFSVFDNLVGSGINPASIVVKLDGVVVPSFYIPALNKVIVFVDPLETHTITVDASDNQGNPAPQVVLEFTVDTSLLGVQSINPDNGSINVPVDTSFQATFSVAVDATTINTTTITLSDESQQYIPGIVSFDPYTSTVTLQPASPLEFQTYYILTIQGGSSGVHDAGGQPMVMDFQFGFRTGAASNDTTPPEVLAVNLGTDDSIIIEFSEPMDPSTTNGSTIALSSQVTGDEMPKTVSYNSMTNEATVIPNNPLNPSESYELRIIGGLGGVADLAGNPLANDYVVEIGGTNQPPSLTAPVEVEFQYSDEVPFFVSAIDPDNSGSELIFTASALPAGLILTDNQDGTATVSGAVTASPGLYSTIITVTDPEGLTDAQIVSIAVNQEDARTTYTGPLLVSTPCTNCSEATVPLRATIQDITAILNDPAFDSYPGDITNATVSFVNRENSNEVLCAATISLIDPANPTVGTATCDWVVTLGSNTGLSFSVGIVVDGYYTRDSTEDDVIVVVSKPGNNFVTGGGFLINENSGGEFAGDIGLNTNFGLNAKFSRNGKTLVGGVKTIIRKDEHVYLIKSIKLTSLVAVPFDENDPNSGTATIVGKANITDITDPDNPVLIASNCTIQITLTDNGEPGTYDTISITLWSKNGTLLFSSNWNGVETIEQILTGGNLQVH